MKVIFLNSQEEKKLYLEKIVTLNFEKYELKNLEQFNTSNFFLLSKCKYYFEKMNKFLIVFLCLIDKCSVPKLFSNN